MTTKVTAVKKFSISAHVAVVLNGETLLDYHTTRRSAESDKEVIAATLRKYGKYDSVADRPSKSVTLQSANTLKFAHDSAENVTLHVSIVRDGGCEKCAQVGTHAEYCNAAHDSVRDTTVDLAAMFGLSDKPEPATAQDDKPEPVQATAEPEPVQATAENNRHAPRQRSRK